MGILIKAPIDEKNVSSDWIEEVFDYAVMIGKTCTGFICDCLVTCQYHGNKVYWEVETKFFNLGKDKDRAWSELKKRLEKYEVDPNPYVITHYYERKKCLLQQLFFKVED